MQIGSAEEIGKLVGKVPRVSVWLFQTGSAFHPGHEVLDITPVNICHDKSTAAFSL
jgi:hypothetical protein